MRTLQCDHCKAPFVSREVGHIHLATYLVKNPRRVNEDDLHNSWCNGDVRSAGDYFELDLCLTCSQDFITWFEAKGQKLA